ncbi:MAG TPA: DUF3488 and transglutaminase-like domain-containing protein [Candidatus Acidoferrum sp.]
MASSATSLPAALPAERFYRVALFLLVLTSVLTLVSTGRLDPFTMVAALSAVLYKGYRWFRGRAPEWSQTFATRLVLAYLCVLPVDLLFVSRNLAEGTANPALYSALLAAVHFLLFVTIVRLYSAATDRDARFLAMLAFAGMLAAAVFTVDAYFLGLFLAFLLFGVAAFVGLEIRRGAAGAVTPVIGAQPAAERRFHRALAMAALSVAAGAIVIGSALFFVFPRFSAGYFGHGGVQPSLMTGFTDSVELGQIGEIKKNTAVVMRVRTGAPVNYPYLRWRGIALANFDGRRWFSGDPNRTAQPSGPDGWIPLLSRGELAGRPTAELHFTVLLQPMASDAIFAPAQLLRVRGNFSAEGGTYDLSMRRSFLLRDSAGSVFNPARNFSQIRYEGVSLLPVARPAEARFASADYPAEIRETYLQLSSLDPRIVELAQRITARANNPYDKAILLETYLRRNFGYTLNLTGKPGQDPLAHFLFETKAGHCEYFASAMAVMLRALGIPSREVNGFLPGEFNDLGGDYIVRASDAHSWVEAYFPGSGWVTFDPTPAAPASSGGLLERLSLYIDWFQLTWNEWIINYDFSHQVLLAKNVRQNSGDWTESLRARFRRFQERSMERLMAWQREHGQLGIAFPILLVLLLVVLRFDWARRILLWLGLAWETHRAPAQRDNPQLASRLYAELLRALERRGYRRAETQTPREFAASTLIQPDLAPFVLEFTDLYAQARFGGAPCDAFRLRVLLDQVRSARPSR